MSRAYPALRRLVFGKRSRMRSAYRSQMSTRPSARRRSVPVRGESGSPGPSVTVSPLARMSSTAWTLSLVLPYLMDRVPAALLPMQPPTLACLVVDGSGAKNRPVLAMASFRSSIVIPGCTRQRRPASSNSTMSRQLAEQSMTIARFTHCPARDVPPPRGSMGRSCSAQ